MALGHSFCPGRFGVIAYHHRGGTDPCAERGMYKGAIRPLVGGAAKQRGGTRPPRFSPEGKRKRGDQVSSLPQACSSLATTSENA